MGNTARLLKRAVQGAEDSGVPVEEIVLRDLKMSPCLELYGCRQDGRCVIRDDFHGVLEKVMAAGGLMLASPIFFYTVSAHTKIFMDRCQSLWVKKYWLEGGAARGRPARKGLFIAAGATRGKNLFAGVLLSMRYFFDVLDTSLWRTLLYRGLDHQGDVAAHPEYLEEAYLAGSEMADSLLDPD